MLSDPAANMLTIIRNAIMRGLFSVQFPYSNFKLEICEKLLKEEYLTNCKKKGTTIKIELAHSGKRSRIKKIEKISTPSQHFYLKAAEIKKKYLQKNGTYIISTSKGLLTHHETMENKIGGKVILYIN